MNVVKVLPPEGGSHGGILRTAERYASGGGALRALGNAGPWMRLGITAFATVAAVIVGGSSNVFACPLCFGAQETSMVDGTRLGIVVMVVITLAVQGGFVGFFLYLRRRAKRIADIELDAEWSELQGSSRTSP